MTVIVDDCLKLLCFELKTAEQKGLLVEVMLEMLEMGMMVMVVMMV